VGILEDRSRRDRNLAVASGTLPQNRTQGPSLGGRAARAAESFRPAELEQIFPAGLLRAKANLEFRQRPRVIPMASHTIYWGCLSQLDTPISTFFLPDLT